MEATPSAVADSIADGLYHDISLILSLGMSLFLASPKERIQVLVALVERQLQVMSSQRLQRTSSTTSGTSRPAAASPAHDAGSAGGSGARQGDLQVLLLSRYFEAMSEVASIVTLLSAVDHGSGADSEGGASLKRLMLSGMTLLVQYTESAVLDVLHSNPQSMTSTPTVPSYVSHLKEFLVRPCTIVPDRVSV